MSPLEEIAYDIIFSWLFLGMFSGLSLLILLWCKFQLWALRKIEKMQAEEAIDAQIQAGIADIKAGRTRRLSASELDVEDGKGKIEKMQEEEEKQCLPTRLKKQ
jgi:hypothetical protein